MTPLRRRAAGLALMLLASQLASAQDKSADEIVRQLQTPATAGQATTRSLSAPSTRSLELIAPGDVPTPAAPPAVPSVDLVIHFAKGSSKILPTSFSQLEKLNEALGAKLAGTRIGIVGHTDSVGTEEYNYRLSRDRAMEVGAYLTSQGIDPQRLYFQGLGKTRMLRPDDPMSAENRSVEIQLLK